MKERKNVRTELLKNMIINLIIFTIIFTTFSVVILIQVSKYLYTSVDNEMYQVKKQFEEMPKIVFTDEQSTQEELEFADNMLIEVVQAYVEKISNPRVITILRDDEGEILASSLNAKIFLKYLQKINFTTNNVDKIYEMCVNSRYYYRGTTCEISTSNGSYYVEFLVNVNSEKEMMESFTDRLTIGTGIVILLSIFISYYLSRRAVDPIIKAYEKQAEFVQNASHELRTPLTIIQAKQEMLLQAPESKIIDKSEDIALTLSETRRLSKMATELMDLARADSNNRDRKRVV